MDNEAQILLDDIVSFCQRDGLDTRLINMLGQSVPVSLDDESLTLQVPPGRDHVRPPRSQGRGAGDGPRRAAAGDAARSPTGMHPYALDNAGAHGRQREDRARKDKR